MDLKDFTANSDWLKSPRQGGALRRRTFSFFVDLFCILLASKLLMASYISYLNTFMYIMGDKSQHLLSSQFHKVEFSVITVVFFGYFFLSYYLGNGKTPGKILFRLKVVPADNPTGLLGFTQSMKRSMAYVFCYLTGFIFFAIPFFNKNRAGLPDMFSESKVLTEDQYNKVLQNIKDQEIEQEATGVQMELNFEKEVSDNVIYLPGPEYFNTSEETEDEEEQAA